MGAKKSLTGEEMEQQEEQDALQKIAEAEALAVQQSGNNVDSAETKCTIIVRFVNMANQKRIFNCHLYIFQFQKQLLKNNPKTRSLRVKSKKYFKNDWICIRWKLMKTS